MLFRVRALRRINGMREEKKKNREKKPNHIRLRGIVTDCGRTPKGGQRCGRRETTAAGHYNSFCCAGCLQWDACSGTLRPRDSFPPNLTSCERGTSKQPCPRAHHAVREFGSDVCDPHPPGCVLRDTCPLAGAGSCFSVPLPTNVDE